MKDTQSDGGQLGTGASDRLTRSPIVMLPVVLGLVAVVLYTAYETSKGDWQEHLGVKTAHYIPERPPETYVYRTLDPLTVESYLRLAIVAGSATLLGLWAALTSWQVYSTEKRTKKQAPKYLRDRQQALVCVLIGIVVGFVGGSGIEGRSRDTVNHEERLRSERGQDSNQKRSSSAVPDPYFRDLAQPIPEDSAQ